MSEIEIESMDAYAEELEKSFRRINVGDIIKGNIIDVSDEGLYIDLKYYAQGFVPAMEVSNDPTLVMNEAYHEGDEIEGTIIKMDDGQGNIVLSLKEASEELSWDKLKELMKEGTVSTVKVSEAVNAGVVAYLEGIRGFIPASQLALSYVEDTSSYLGKVLEVVVITVDEEKQKLVLSAKTVEQKKREEELNSRKSHLAPGTVFEGTVESIMPYGAFIDLGNDLSGLLHISRISQKRLKSPSEVLKEGQKVKVKLIDVKDGKLSLSMKEFEEVLEVAADSEETFEYHDEGEATTSLAGLFANIKL